MQRPVLILLSAVRLATFPFTMVLATLCGAAQPVVPTADQCLAELRSGRSEWIECYGGFETDASAQAELSKQTFDIVRNAKCGGAIRVLRAALKNALADNGVLELERQEVLCSITTNGDSIQQVTITLAPKVSFQGNRAADVSPRISKITNLPEFVVAPLRLVAESGFVRSQLTNGLNGFLEQAFPK